MTEKQWWKVLKGKSPKNPAWLGFADWLEEQGEDGKAYGARVVFEQGLKPHHSNDSWKNEGNRSWDWWKKPNSDEPYYNIPNSDEPHSIPNSSYLDDDIFAHLTGWSAVQANAPAYNYWKEYNSRLEAYQDLLNAYALLHKEKHQ